MIEYILIKERGTHYFYTWIILKGKRKYNKSLTLIIKSMHIKEITIQTYWGQEHPIPDKN